MISKAIVDESRVDKQCRLTHLNALFQEIQYFPRQESCTSPRTYAACPRCCAASSIVDTIRTPRVTDQTVLRIRFDQTGNVTAVERTGM